MRNGASKITYSISRLWVHYKSSIMLYCNNNNRKHYTTKIRRHYSAEMMTLNMQHRLTYHQA